LNQDYQKTRTLIDCTHILKSRRKTSWQNVLCSQ